MPRHLFPKGAPPARVALGFANAWSLAVSNLGFRIVSQLLGSFADLRVERFYLPTDRLPLPPNGVVTEPSRARLSSVDLVLFSLSFEGDAVHLPAILEAGGLPPLAGDRRHGHPLVIGGGAVVMMNPEPLAAFFDLFLVGEAEVLLEEFLRRWGELRGEERGAMIAELATLRGAIAPALRAHRVWSAPLSAEMRADETVILREGGTAAGLVRQLPPAGSPVATVKWEVASDQVSAARMPREAELPEVLLLELARGCPRRCRFCLGSRIYAPLRTRSADLLVGQAAASARAGETVGLMALSAGDHAELDVLAERLHQMGLRISLSSLPPNFRHRRAAEALVASGSQTMTLAPETGSERLRTLVGKPVRNARIIETVRMLGEVGVRRLRTYFLIGLPFEEREDVRAIADLIAEMRGVLPLGCRLSATINAFVPKPRTPFQWAPLAGARELREKARLLVTQAPWGVRVKIKSLREARWQAALARGDVRWGERLLRLAAGETPAAVLREEGLHLGDLTGSVAVDSPLPWDDLMDRRESQRLRREWQRACRAAGSS